MTKPIVLAAVLALALALASLPIGASTHPSTACDSGQSVHSYTGAGGAFAGISINFLSAILHASETQAFQTGTVEAYDTCDQDLDGDGIFGDYDGDMESGYGGGRFPAGTNGAANDCYTAPEWPHHGYGSGAQYWADDETGLVSIAYQAGADGPAIVPDPTDPCTVDGIISNDPTTDPADCGAGATGFYAPPIWTPATMGETVSGNDACNPFDGTAWVIILAGFYVETWAGSVYVLTPVSGHIWG